MDKPIPLDSLFKEKLFRIPDYQRGYAWQREHLKAFWEDLINLAPDRSHYTGVLTLKEIPKSQVPQTSKEFWLVEDHSYRLYHIVDGQQRLTTFIIFLQAVVEFFQALPENEGKKAQDIFVNGSLSLAALQDRFLYRVKPGDQFRTYIFGYTEDNPSDQYLRHSIMNEIGAGSIQETFYTLNLSNAKRYFLGQLQEMHQQNGLVGIQEIYKKLTHGFKLNEYVIPDEFDVSVAFETMNNRGKKLSDLELLKNRLIYLITLYTDEELDAAERDNLRATVNDAWKEIYHQLGRNKTRPLNDDDFLRAHWSLYFKYSRKTGKDYIRFLLDQEFTPQRVHKKVERDVVLEIAVEQSSSADGEDDETDDEAGEPETPIRREADLSPTRIRDYVLSLKQCAVYWFNSFYPHLIGEMSLEERRWIDSLNRVGIAYFRPLVMSVLKNEPNSQRRIEIFKKIERFIFIIFRMNSLRSNSASSQFYNLARLLDQKEASLERIGQELDNYSSYTFLPDGAYRSNDFHSVLFKKFKSGSGFYGWAWLRYFLYEYELSLLSTSRQPKVEWDDLLKNQSDRISIEHIYPQTPTDSWANAFSEIPDKERAVYGGNLGNLLLLSASINSALQNDSFESKKQARFDADGRKTRNGYADGSHSEIEVCLKPAWGPAEIRDRSLHLLKFMETRWAFRFADDTDRARFLFLADQSLVP